MRRLPWWLPLTCLAFGSPVLADVTATDLQVAARALSFVENPLSGAVRVGIVYERASPRSLEQAEGLRRMLGAGLRAGNLELRPVMVEWAQAGSANVDLFFLTEHVAARDAHTSSMSKRQQVPCITTDIEQVRSGACIMGVRSRPKVEILVNRTAAEASGITFATVFRLMITEI